MSNARAITIKNGKPTAQGVCPRRGTKVLKVKGEIVSPSSRPRCFGSVRWVENKVRHISRLTVRRGDAGGEGISSLLEGILLCLRGEGHVATEIKLWLNRFRSDGMVGRIDWDTQKLTVMRQIDTRTWLAASLLTLTNIGPLPAGVL